VSVNLAEVPEPIKELLECLEIFMEAADGEDVDPEFLNTAYYQATELVMQLLSDHLELIDLFQAAADEAQQVEEVGKIIRPALYVPGQ
jgi:hypothetical protein